MSFMDSARERLQSEDATERASMLRALSAGREVADDVLGLVEKLLDDRSVARMYIPFKYGELRYIAAETYSKMLFYRGRLEPFVLPNTIIPIKAEKMVQIRMNEGLLDDPPYKSPLEWFAELRDRGLLEIVDGVFDRQYFDMDD
jgi:hypothetical protein